MSLKVGDRVPNFQLPALDGLDRVFYFEVLGGPIILIAVRNAASFASELLSVLSEYEAEMRDLKVQTFFVTDNVSGLDDVPLGTIVYRDEKGELSDFLLAREGGKIASEALYLLDENQRVYAQIETNNVVQTVINLREAIAKISNRFAVPPSTLRYGAPTLLMDNLLDLDLCDQLINSWKQNNREGLVNDGNSNAPDGNVKKNREHVVTDDALRREIANQLGPRIIPELEKAFNYSKPLRFEAFTVLSYTHERKDFFAPHRDNLRATQKRQFAMSLNLNEGYEGGELWFPEYGPHKFLPNAGSGVIFSCSLLHEALPVTKGQRWVLVTFMCD